MAVQKSKKSRSRGGSRRAHNALSNPTVSDDVTTGTRHLRHHMASDGFYRGKEYIAYKTEEEATDEEQA